MGWAGNKRMATSGSAANGVEISPDGSRTYIVQHGDTLAGVALRLGVTKSELKRANRMFGTVSLMTGQQLKVLPKTTPDYGGVQSGGEQTRSAREYSSSSSAGAGAKEGDEGSQRRVPPQGGLSEEEKWLDLRGVQARAESSLAATPLSVGVVAGGGRDGDSAELSSARSHWEGGATEEIPPVRRLSNVSSASAGSFGGGGARGTAGGGRSSFRAMINSILSPCSATDPSTAAKKNDRKFGSDSIGYRKSREVSFSAAPPSTPSENSPGAGSSTNGDPHNDQRRRQQQQQQQQHHQGVDSDSEAELDRSRAASTAQLMLQYVKPSYWGLGGGGGAAAAAAPVAAPHSDDLHGAPLGGAEGPEDGESEAATERRRSRSYVCDDAREDQLDSELIAEVMSRWDGEEDVDADAAFPPRVQTPELVLPGLVAGASTIVTHSTLARLELALPKHFRGYNWYLLYSTYRDGANWIQFYNRVKDEVPTYLIVENMEGEVFGGFAASAWASTSKYYGTGESFLFSATGTRSIPPKKTPTTTPPPTTTTSTATADGSNSAFAGEDSEGDNTNGRDAQRKDEQQQQQQQHNPQGARTTDMVYFSRGTFEDDMASASPRTAGTMPSPAPSRKSTLGFSATRSTTSNARDGVEDGDDSKRAFLEAEVTTYGWAGMNTYFQYSDDVGIGMGGGGGNFGLFVGEDLLAGTTGSCETFDNPPLCSKEAFDVSQVEVWGFTTASTEVGARMERLRKTLRGRTTRPL